MGKKEILMSFSGGRSSALALRLLTMNGVPENMVILFANTGREKPQTLDFVHECGVRWDLPIVWVEADFLEKKEGMTQREQIIFKQVDYNTCSRKGEPFEEMIKRFGLPNRMFRFCTQYLKQIPMFRYMQSLGCEDWDTVMGIRWDEPERVVKNKGHIMPLVAAKITQQQVRQWWAKQPFDLQLKDYEGNCDLCHLKSQRKRQTILVEQPEIADWWIRMEEMTGSEFQQGMPVKRLLELSRGKRFAKVQDSYQKSLVEPELFGDVEISCFCGD
jgi:hypothetical protein